MADVVWEAILDLSQPNQQLGQFERRINNLSGRGSRSFNRVGGAARSNFRIAGQALQALGIRGAASFGAVTAAAAPLAVALAGMLVALKALQIAFDLAKKAATAFFDIVILGSIETSKEFELNKARLTAVFEGQEDVGEAVFQKLIDQSKDLGVNIVDAAASVAPFATSLEDLALAGEAVAGLQIFDPRAGPRAASRAIRELLSGDLQVLKRGFEIPEQILAPVTEAIDAGDITGALSALNEGMQEIGISIGQLSDTWAFQLRRMQTNVEALQGVVGEPILDELQVQFQNLLDIMEPFGPTFEVIAHAIGLIAADVVEFAGEGIADLLASLDVDLIQNIVVNIGIMSENFQMLLRTFNRGEGDFNIVNAALGAFNLVIQAVSISVSGLSLIMTGVGTAFKLFESGIVNAIGAIRVAKGDITFEEFMAIKKPLDVIRESSIQFAKSIVETKTEVEELTGELDTFEGNLGKVDEAALKAAESMLRLAAAARATERLLELVDEAAEVNAEILSAREDFQIQANIKFLETEKDFNRDWLDLTIDNARELMKIEQDRLDDIEDARRKNNERITDAATDLTRDEEDIARDHADRFLELEIDRSHARIDIEKDFQRDLEKIRRRFLDQLEDAMRANDAIAFLRIKRRMARELDERKRRRDEDFADTEDDFDRRREKLNRALENERRDADTNNERKLEDLQLALTRELNEIEINAQRERVAQALALQQARDDLNMELDRTIADYNDWWRERFRVVEKGIRDEIAQYHELLREIASISRQIMQLQRGLLRAPFSVGETSRNQPGQGSASNFQRLQALARQRADALGITGEDFLRLTQGLSFSELAALVEQWEDQLGLAAGGIGMAGTSAIVGERGPELITFPRDGFVIPNETFFSPPAFAGGGSGVDNSRSNEFNFSMLDPNNITPMMEAKLRMIVADMMIGSV